MEEIFNKIDEILERKKQIILYGVPGVGKTYLAKKFAESQNDVAMYKTITFHQSFAYEEFIEGLKPKSEKGEVVYKVEDGIFKKMCILAIWEALKNKNSIRKIKLNTIITIRKL